MKLNSIQIDKDDVYFTSDSHFFHENIIKYTDRPFDNAKEMNEALIENWNLVVPPLGLVFHTGDVALGGSPKRLDDIMHKLNGIKYLVKGNHEKSALHKEYLRDHWAGIHDIIEIEIEDEEITYGRQHIVMCHYPMLTWNGAHRGSWQLFGHVHGGLSNKGVIKHKPTQLDVGVDCHDFAPISYQRVKELITKQSLIK